MAEDFGSGRKTAMIMAGGTGGHIFPGLALAELLARRGWRVRWIGAPDSMESRLVRAKGIEFDAVEFAGLRRKGLLALARLPWALSRACWKSAKLLGRERPDVVVGFGGYMSFPAGLMAGLMGIPLALHEQNAVMGLANRALSLWADRLFCAFPLKRKGACWIGNPLRGEFLEQQDPQARYAERSGPLRLLVVGGSLGAQSLNKAMPKALGLLAGKREIEVVHQSGERHMEELARLYAGSGVAARLAPFVERMGEQMAWADVAVCRSGASTVSELAAVGLPALLVPFPGAVDDHQAANALLLADAGAGWLRRESELEPAWLAEFLERLDRKELAKMACAAQGVAKLGAAEALARACEELGARRV